MKLTANEISLLNAMRQNEFNDALAEDHFCGTWSFTAIDYSGMTAKVARGVISSLVKKDLVHVSGGSSKDDPESIGFTDAGAKLFDTADGKACSWGGQPLLKTEYQKSIDAVEALNDGKIDSAGKPRKTKTVKVALQAFTGMFIGEFEATKTATTITVVTKKSTLTFDAKTLLQTNAKNPKFANKIVIQK